MWYDLHYCKKCFNISEESLCDICQNFSRDTKKLCVVEDPLDVIAIERTKKYTGLYFVIGGTLETIRKNNANQLKFDELKNKVKITRQTAFGDFPRQ